MDGIHSMQILYKGDNGELLLFSWQHFATAVSPSSLLPFPAMVLLCMTDEIIASCGTASPTFTLKPFQSVMCLLWNIYKGIISWLHLLEVSHGAAQIMLSCLWKKSTQLDLPLQDSLWMRSVLLGWSSWKLRFKLSFKMSV